MHWKTLVVAVAAVTLKPMLAQAYLVRANIKNFYVVGASIDWYEGTSNTANGRNHIELLSRYDNWNVRKYAFPGAVTHPNIFPATSVPPFGNQWSPIVNWNAQIEQAKGIWASDRFGTQGANGANSLFVITASNTGNDILNSWNTTRSTSALRDSGINAALNLFQDYFINLYDSGARNFVFFSVLPVHLTPAIATRSQADQTSVKAFVDQYNQLLRDRVSVIKAVYPQANIFNPDITPIVNQISTNTLGGNGPTAGYYVRNNFCPEVATEKTGALTARNPNKVCAGFNWPGRRYLYWDHIHFTAPAHCEYAYRTAFDIFGFGISGYPSGCQYANANDNP